MVGTALQSDVDSELYKNIINMLKDFQRENNYLEKNSFGMCADIDNIVQKLVKCKCFKRFARKSKRNLQESDSLLINQ